MDELRTHCWRSTAMSRRTIPPTVGTTRPPTGPSTDTDSGAESINHDFLLQNQPETAPLQRAAEFQGGRGSPSKFVSLLTNSSFMGVCVCHFFIPYFRSLVPPSFRCSRGRVDRNKSDSRHQSAVWWGEWLLELCGAAGWRKLTTI